MCHGILLTDALVCKIRGQTIDEPHTNRSLLAARTRRSASHRSTRKRRRTIPLGQPPNERVLQEHHVCDATTSCDVPSRSIGTSEAEDTFTSCQLGLDHPSSKLSMSMCLLPHDWLENILISNGS